MVPPQALMFRAAVLKCLVDGLSLTVGTFRAIKKDWDLDQNEVERMGIVSCPGKIQNLIASEVCAFKFGDLSTVPGLYGIDRLPCNCATCEICSSDEVQLDQLFESQKCICALKSWRVDIDERLASHGVILPTRDSQGWISDLWVYRHTRDGRPFPLRVREVVAA
jgi:hypothetical protein